MSTSETSTAAASKPAVAAHIAVESAPISRIVPGFGRIPVADVSPVVMEGAYPARAVVG